MEKQSPLDQLFTDSRHIKPENLVNVLKDQVLIQRGTGVVIFSSAGSKLSAGKKLIIFLLAKKVFALRSGEGASDEVSSGQIARETGLKSGTVDPTLKRLRELGLVQSVAGKYSVIEAKWESIKEYIES